MTNQVWHDDPRRLVFTLSRYKFIAKMLSGKRKVLEVGCADAFGTRIVLQEVGDIVAVDVDPIFIQDVKDRVTERWKFDCRVHDILSGPVLGTFDAAYSLDLIEHIPKEDDERAILNITRSLVENGVLIMGSPSMYSQAYASPQSKIGHVNCKTQDELKALMLKFFHNVFMFGMNDEVVHTGFAPMTHYLIAVAVGRRTLA
ncbi:MAG: class I SAM-dependent methyltransferase [Desulfomonile tiedjei]|nr:class I SAM-dependent methyltransferase [Desulfomonile tiedjei]